MKSKAWSDQESELDPLKESEIWSKIVISGQTSDQISFPEIVLAPELKQPLGRKQPKCEATVKNSYTMYNWDENFD